MKQKLIMIILLSNLLWLNLVGCMVKSKSVEPTSEPEVVETVEEQTEEEHPVVDYNVGFEETDEPKLEYLGEFWLTGYCDCEECQGPWSGTTALGVPPREGWTVAVDPEVIPLGSYIIIDGHRYKAEDTGSAIKGNDIDIFVGSHEECYSDFCNGWHEVWLEVLE